VIFKRPTGCSFLFLDGVYINFSTPKIKKRKKKFPKENKKKTFEKYCTDSPFIFCPA